MSKIVIGNQKMYMNKEDVLAFVETLKNTNMENRQVIVCPTFPFLEYYNNVVPVGAQNVAINDNGAYTGEVSASQLKSLNIPYCIIGHSERRQYFNETDEAVNKKAKVLLENGITPVICVGETLEEREANVHMGRIEDQVRQAIDNIDVRFVDRIIIAYEPIWAIGTGKTATKEQAEEMCSHIRYNVAKMYGLNVADNVRIQYGGSVNEANAKELFEMPNIDGALVGGASLKPTFTNIIKAAR